MDGDPSVAWFLEDMISVCLEPNASSFPGLTSRMQGSKQSANYRNYDLACHALGDFDAVYL